MTVSLTDQEKITIVSSKLKNLNYNKFSIEVDRLAENAKSSPDAESVSRFDALLTENALQISALSAELSKYTAEQE